MSDGWGTAVQGRYLRRMKREVTSARRYYYEEVRDAHVALEMMYVVVSVVKAKDRQR
jgi:hypothetical protein